MASDGGCEASVPLAAVEGDQARATAWALCGAPVTRVTVLRCPNGHRRYGRTCDAHAPRPGQVGCRVCFAADGTEVPMTAAEWS
jgi:hypothetical protein